MVALDVYMNPETLPGTEAARVGKLLGLKESASLDDILLADHVASGLAVSAAEALGDLLGRASIVGPLIPEATLRRAAL